MSSGMLYTTHNYNPLSAVMPQVHDVTGLGTAPSLVGRSTHQDDYKVFVGLHAAVSCRSGALTRHGSTALQWHTCCKLHCGLCHTRRGREHEPAGLLP